MTVAFLRKTGLAVGALTTTAPGAEVTLDGLGSLELPVRSSHIVHAGGTSADDDKVAFTAVQFAVGDLAIVTTQADFDDPADVFEWRVITTSTPDGRDERHLEQLAGDGIKVKYTAGSGSVTVTVLHPGNAAKLDLEIRDPTTRLGAGTLNLALGECQKTFVVTPGNTPIVVIVEGYAPILVKRSP